MNRPITEGQVNRMLALGRNRYQMREVKLDALCWQVFGCSIHLLVEAEAATLPDVLQRYWSRLPVRRTVVADEQELERGSDHLAARLEHGWQVVAEAKANTDPHTESWGDAWLELLGEYVILCERIIVEQRLTETGREPLALQAA